MLNSLRILKYSDQFGFNNLANWMQIKSLLEFLKNSLKCQHFTLAPNKICNQLILRLQYFLALNIRLESNK